MIKEFFRKTKSSFQIAPDESDLFLTLGTASFFYGAFLVYPPAAYMLLGCIFFIIAYLQAKGGN